MISFIRIVLIVVVSFNTTLSYADEHDKIGPELESELVLSLEFESVRQALNEEQTRRLYERQFVYEVEFSRFHHWDNKLGIFLDASVSREHAYNSTEKTDRAEALVAVDQLWLQWSSESVAPFSFRAGRQSIADESGWWWDDDLNGLSMNLHANKFQFRAAILEQAEPPMLDSLPNDPELDSIRWFLSSMHYQLNEQNRLSAYYSKRDDQSASYVSGQVISEALFDEEDDKLQWLGLRWQNAFTLGEHNVDFHADAALMTGRLNRYALLEEDEVEESEAEEGSTDNNEGTEGAPDSGESTSVSVIDKTSQSVDGWALNTWLRWTPPFAEQTSLSVGYAVGSGTEAGRADGSGTFQQTGLKSNELDNHYYGAILEPELSNLHVATVQLHGTVGVIPGQYQITHHRYFTDSTADDIFGGEYEWLSADRNRKLGNETSISYAVEIVDGFEFKATLARLRMNTLADSQRDKSIEYAQVLISYEF